MEEKLAVSFSRKDESLPEELSGEYDLTAFIGEHSFIYCLRDREKDRFVAAEVLKEPLERVLQAYPWLGQPFRSVHLVIENNKSTLVPEMLYEDSDRENLLDFTVDRGIREQILADHLQHPQVYNLFAVPEDLLNRVKAAFPTGKICHVTSTLIETLWINFKNRLSARKLFVHLRDGSFDLVVYDGAQLYYANSFSFLVPEDIAYYVIFVMEQLGLNPEETGAVLLGQIDRKSPVFELLFRYIRNLEFASRGESVRVSPAFHDVPEHFLYLLLNPVLCGS